MRALLTAFAILLGLTCQAEVISGKVVSVADGDTVTILDASKVQHKVRLAGIDAPERAQAFGERSREALADLVAGRAVIVETHKEDRYGRLIGKILLNGRDVNREQVRSGMAWFYRDYAHEQTEADQQSYDRAETEAKDFRRGLWADKRPVPPWEFRKKSRQ